MGFRGGFTATAAWLTVGSLTRSLRDLFEFLRNDRHGADATIMHVGGGSAVDQQAEQLRAAVVAARIHQPLPPVDHPEIEISYHRGNACAPRLAHQFAFRGDDRGEAAARNRADLATGVLHDLRL